MWIKYVEDTIPAPLLQMDMGSFSEKYFPKVLEVYNDFLKKLNVILIAQNLDPEVKAREFTALFAMIPLRDLYDLYKEDLQKKKKNHS